MVVAAYFYGMIIYLSLWYRKKEQTIRISIFFGGAIVAGAFGGIMVSISRIFNQLDLLKTTSNMRYHRNKKTVERKFLSFYSHMASFR
jgi:hypothetical protein